MMVYEKRYHWGKKHHGVKAQIAGEEIDRIQQRDGVVTKETLLDESRPEEAPLHPAFEWDDTKAAEKYRLTQAKSIINDIVVEVIRTGEDEPKKVPAFVNVVKGLQNNAQYLSVDVAMSDEDHRKAVLENAKSEFNAFKRKYSNLTELAGVFAEIDKL